MTWLLAGVKLMHLAAAMLVCGGVAFALVVEPEVAPRKWTQRTVSAAVLASAVGWLLVVAVNMSGRPIVDLDGETLRRLLTSTAFGTIWCLQLALSGALIGVSWAKGRTGRLRQAIALLLSGALLVNCAAAGHAGTAMGSGGVLRIAVQALHLLAAAVWLGGLVPLLRALRSAGDGDNRTLPTLARLVDRFSALAMVAVAALLLTGAINAGGLIGSSGFVASTWTHVLAIKLALVSALLALAAINRLILLPRLHQRTAAAPAAAVIALVRTVRLELGLAILVLFAASLLGTLPPPIGGE